MSWLCSVHRMAGLLFTWQLKKAKWMWCDCWLRPGLSSTYRLRYLNGLIMYLLFTSKYTVEPLIMDPPRSERTPCEGKYSFLSRGHYLCHTDWRYSTLHCQSQRPHCTYSYCMMSCLLLCTGWRETHRRCQSRRSLWHCPSAGERKQVELDNYSRRMWKL